MSITISQLSTVTREHYRPKLVDQFFRANPVFDRMEKQNRVSIRGGRVIRFPISYDDLNNVMAFEGAEVLDTNQNDTFTQGEIAWREYSTTVAIPQRDLDLNEGEEQLLDYLKAKMDNARRSLNNRLGTDLYSSGGSKKLDGFESFILATPTYAGIAQTDISDWAANVNTITANTLTLFDLTKLIGECTDGNERPTLIVTRQSVWDRIHALLQADQRFAPATEVNGGFETLKWAGIPIMVDSHITGSDGGSTNNHLYCLNENYLHMAIHPNGNFKVEAIPLLKDQRIKMVRFYFMGNVYCTKLRLQGAIKTIDPDLD